MNRIAILGTGLIGGSIGLRVRSLPSPPSVVGFDAVPSVVTRAHQRGAVVEAVHSIAAAVTAADLVVVATPVDQLHRVLTELEPHLAPGAIVTDVGSAKAEAVAIGESVVGDRFVGGHPMAGSERHGIEAADAMLFEDAWWILTPSDRTSSDAYRVVAGWVAGLGGKPIAVTPEVHDALLARLSHLPQLVASAIVGVAASGASQESLLGLAAGGFRDVTRIAASHPDLWVSIVRANSPAVLEALADLQRRLEVVGAAISAGRWDELGSFLELARSARLELFAKSVYTGDPVALTLLIPDRPGVLAEVTTAAGELGANIEDIQIFHSTEGGRGRLELVVAGSDAAEGLLARLRELGYHVEIGLPE